MLQEVREIISTRGTGIQGIAIANYIATRIDKKGDSKLEQNILESQKGIADCLDYCSKQAKQFAKNNVAMIADSTVFSWVMDYYNGEWKKDNSVAKNIKKTETSGELLRLIEVGASCFNHYCVDYDIRNHTSYTMSTGV